MNLRHTAALALVGWYLIVPPETMQARDYLVPRAEWQKLGVFDDADKCMTAKRRIAKYANDDQKKRNCLDTDSSAACLADRAAANSECMADDDPRLIGN
jgi:hypothetical protein